MFDMFKSPVAGGIALGLGMSCVWAVPALLASWTGTGINGFGAFSLLMLLLVAAIAEYRARKRKRA